MFIQSIQLKNFLCYYGENNVFEFSEGLNLVLGANGYGKTKLYDAFLWVIKDRISDNSPGNRDGYKKTMEVKKDLVSQKALAECAIGEAVKAEVILEVGETGNTQNKSYQLIRSYFVNHKAKNQWIEQNNSKLEILEKDVLHFKPIPENQYQDIIERLLPSDVQPYVWFQGERGINNLIDTSNDASLKNVIKKLSDIDRWDKYIAVSNKAAETANNALQKAQRASQKNHDEILRLQKQEEHCKKNIEKINTEITETQKNLTAAQGEYDNLSSVFENAQNLDKLKKEKHQIEKEIESLENQIDLFYQGFSKNLFSRYWLLKGMGAFIKDFEILYKQYSEKVAERKATHNLKKNLEKKLQTRLPEGVPEPVYIQTMLDKEHCLVCDRPAPEGSPPYKAIQQLLEKETTTEIESSRNNFDSIYRHAYHSGLSLSEQIDEIKEDQKKSMLELQDLKNQINDFKAQREAKDKEIQDQLTIGNIENPRYIIDSFNSKLSDIKRYSIRLGEYKANLETAERELENIYKDLDKLSEGEVPPKLKIKRDLLSDFASLAKRVKNHKYEELIQLLEYQANLHYEHINAPTGAFYGKIKFSGTLEGGYKPIIEDEGHEASLLNTSLISSMKLSIIMAIVSANKQRNYAHFYPLIADAPTSDFDDVKMKYFLQEISNTFRQTIIITKEMLIEDVQREKRYKPNMNRVIELKEDLEKLGKTLKLYLIDLPDGISSENKKEIQIEIKPVSI